MTPASLGYRRLRIILIAAYAMLCVVMLSYVVLDARSDYRRMEREAYARTATLARALEEHVARTFALIDLQLRVVGQRLVDTRALERPSTPALVETLSEAAQQLGIVISIYVYDASARGHTTSLGRDVRSFRAGSFEHIRNAFESDADKLFFGRLSRGSVTGEWNLPVARRIVGRSGHLAGVIGTAIKADYFAGFYGSLQAGSGTSLRLIRSDGVVLARFPNVAGLPVELSGLPLFRQRIAKEPGGTLDLESRFDGRRRVLSFRHVPGFDLIVSAAEDYADWVSRWRLETFQAVAVIVVFLGVLLALLVFSLQELQRHAEAEERYALVVRATNDGIWDWNPPARRGYLSQRFGEILGYQESELAGVDDPLLHFVHPDDKAQTSETIEDQLRLGDSYETEARLRRKEGSYRWILARGIAQRGTDGHIVRTTGSMTDITERRNATAALQANAARIRDLLRRLVEAQEAERRRFAADLHDVVGQNLSAIGIELERLKGMLSAETARKTTSIVDALERLIAESIAALRQVISDLRPTLLDDYGLPAAIKSHTKGIEQHWPGLEVAVDVDAAARRPAPAVELALFRIAQEALANCARHSGASRVRIALSQWAGALRLCIEDNGRGIATAAATADRSSGWGTAFMRERAEALGGSLSIEDTGAGTRVVAEIPDAYPHTSG